LDNGVNLLLHGSVEFRKENVRSDVDDTPICKNYMY